MLAWLSCRLCRAPGGQTGGRLALALTRPSRTDNPGRRLRPIRAPALVALAAVVGCVGVIYGIGGGSVLAPVLIGAGRKPSQVAPAALAATFVTSVGGVITFTLLSLEQHIPVAPDWPTGIALVVGIGAYYLCAGLS